MGGWNSRSRPRAKGTGPPYSVPARLLTIYCAAQALRALAGGLSSARACVSSRALSISRSRVHTSLSRRAIAQFHGSASSGPSPMWLAARAQRHCKRSGWRWRAINRRPSVATSALIAWRLPMERVTNFGCRGACGAARSERRNLSGYLYKARYAPILSVQNRMDFLSDRRTK